MTVDHGYIGEPSNLINFDLDSWLINESYFDAPGEFPDDDGLYLYGHDLKLAVDTDGLDMLNEFYNPDSTGDKNILPDLNLYLGIGAHDLKNDVDMDGLDMLNEFYFNPNIDNFQYSPDSTGDKNILPGSFLKLGIGADPHTWVAKLSRP